jgi:hypothetical protein
LTNRYIAFPPFQEYCLTLDIDSLYPNLLAGDQIDSENPRRWLLVSREINVPDSEEGYGRFSLDHLFLDQDAIPTLVEVKRSSDTRIRREVVGQMMDYAANAVVYWPVETIKVKFVQNCEKSELSPKDELQKLLDSETDQESFWQKVKDNIGSGKIRLVFVADEIPTELRRIVEFLNEQMDPAEVLAIEIHQYFGDGLKTLVPRVIGQTQKAIRKKKGIKDEKQWDESSFFDEITKKRGQQESKVAHDILEWAKKNKSGIWWGKGKVTGSFVPTFDTSTGIQHLLFAVFTNGNIQIYFQAYQKRPGFESEEKRMELLNKLNEISGVNIPPDGISRYPSIPLSSFLDKDNLNHFFQVYEWFLKEIEEVERN